MIKIIDSNRLNRNALLANAASVGGLLLMMASVALPMFIPALATISLVMLVVGLGCAMVGIFFANRWVRKPRPEEQINQALKSLSDQYRVYHFPRLPVDHVLLTPSGMVLIETIPYQGMFVYRNGRWKENMTIGRAIRYIVEEHLGNPTASVAAAVEEVKRLCAAAGLPAIPVKGLVLFSHPAAQVEVNQPPLPVCRIEKLKKLVDPPAAKLPADTLEKYTAYLDEMTVRL